MIPPKLTNTTYAREQLREMVENDPADWAYRKTFARFLYDCGETVAAADLVWEAPEIPSIDLEIAFAARILAKGTPRRAIRLLTAVLEQNHGKPVQNLGIANALLHHGMVMQAARFYGAAIEGAAGDDGDLLNADIEHFLLWIDDRRKLWGDFEGQKDELDELPWMKSHGEQVEALRKAMKSTTPIRVPNLPAVAIEEPQHPMYVQSPQRDAEVTPPPAVTIPIDRVAEKDRLYDKELGAEVVAPKRGNKAPDGGAAPQSTPRPVPPPPVRPA